MITIAIASRLRSLGVRARLCRDGWHVSTRHGEPLRAASLCDAVAVILGESLAGDA